MTDSQTLRDGSWLVQRLERSGLLDLATDVCAWHGLSVASLGERSETGALRRTKTRSAARADLLRNIRDGLGWSYPELGAMFGMDHTSVMSAIRRSRARRAGVPVVPDLIPSATPGLVSTAPIAPLRPSGPVADARELGWTAAHDEALARDKGAA